MDRYSYLGTLYYLTSVYLSKISTRFIFFCIFLIQNTNTPIKFLVSLPMTNKYLMLGQTLIKFLAPLSGKLLCFMLISVLSASLVLQTFIIIIIIIIIISILCVFEFFILFVFFLLNVPG